jgi:ATP-dependent DNA helicase RecQ
MKSITVSKEDFEKIAAEIMNQLEKKPLPVKELLQNLRGFKKEKAWKVIDFLQAENKIEVDGDGMARLREK